MISVSRLKKPGDMGLEFLLSPVDFGAPRPAHEAESAPGNVALGTVLSSTASSYSCIQVESV